jgi:hypothetical protein
MELVSWPKKWSDAVAARRRISSLPNNSPPRPWPLLGMLALGLVAGAAIGGYAVSPGSQMRRLVTYAHRIGDDLAAMGRRGRGESPPQIQD